MGSVLPFDIQDKRGMNKAPKKISMPVRKGNPHKPNIALRMQGWDDCLMGVAFRCGKPDLFVYDATEIVKKLMETGDLTKEEAFSHFQKNIAHKWLGEGTPLMFAPMAPDVSHETKEPDDSTGPNGIPEGY